MASECRARTAICNAENIIFREIIVVTSTFYACHADMIMASMAYYMTVIIYVSCEVLLLEKEVDACFNHMINQQFKNKQQPWTGWEI